jgi:hypothetical protein
MPRMPLGGCWPAAFTRTVIIGSKNAISAPSPQTKGRKNYNFVSWSDDGAQTHDVIAPATATTFTARFVADRRRPPDRQQRQRRQQQQGQLSGHRPSGLTLN